jgi:hypothetical protein
MEGTFFATVSLQNSSSPISSIVSQFRKEETMTNVWMYSVAASKDPDNILCSVPWRVDGDLTFFGPCKKRMRERLRSQFLGIDNSHATVIDQLFIVGVNGGNSQRVRKVVWWGRISEVMTFCDADRRLRGNRFRKLRDDRDSPLHVRPLLEEGKLIGYEHVSNEHIKGGAWISDLVSNSARQNARVDGRRLILQHGNPWEAFDRDCCMLIENRFFAQGEGIDLDEEALEILREAQHDKTGIDSYAVFGLTVNGHANGLRGAFLDITDELADRFIAWLEERSAKPTVNERAGYDGTTKTRCP